MLGESQAFFAPDTRIGEADPLQAAGSAVRAAGGQGEDARYLPDKVVCLLRRQALGWLRADLASYAQQTEGNEALWRPVRQRLVVWQQDAHLASGRDGNALDQ
jgi:hypothetical protein